MEMQDFSFQGVLRLGTRRAGGKPGILRDVGDAPKCTVSLTSETEKRKESRTGQRLTSGVLDKGKEATVALTLNYASAKNLAEGLYGTINQVAGGTATAEALPSGLAVDDEVALDFGDVSSVVITDSAGTPATLTAGTHYEVASANAGVIRILDVGSFTQPFKAAYSYGAAVDVTMFSATPPERYLLLDGINTVDNQPVTVHLYRCKFQPLQNLDLINDSYGQIELTGEVLYDTEAVADASLGPFGKIRQRGA